MRVLITNCRLAERFGTECYVRDVATALLARGHAPIVFSPTLGEVADEIRRRTIPVVDDLSLVAEPPDVIHAHHHLETMMAALRFPETPIVAFCHGWLPLEEAPVRFPTIRRYVVVDQPCADRLTIEHCIDRRAVRLIRNFVDLDRFRPRGPLPARPARALLLNNAANEHNLGAIVREACRRRGVTLDVIGHTAGNASSTPEKLLGGYDVVLAKGRTALEALAVGNAVVLSATVGIGPMVTAADFDRLRDLNFGMRALQRPVEVAEVERQLARYDPADAAEVSRRIRAEAALDPAIDEILRVYGEAIGEHSAAPPADAEKFAAASSYLRWLEKPVKEHDQARGAAVALQNEIARLRERVAAESAASAELAAIEKTITWRLRSRLRRYAVLRWLARPVFR